jgi:DNA-directed RNA polymerase beta subunit
MSGDAPFYIDGVVEDITIYANSPINPEVPHMKQLAEIYNQQQAYYAKIAEVLSAHQTMGATLSDEALFELSRARKFISDQKWFMDGEFDNMVIVFKVSKRKKAVVGSKVTNRYGGKGVISEIRKREDMPGGVDVVLNTLGVVNRLNPASLYELELNFIANEFIRLYLPMYESNYVKLSAIIDFVGIINKVQAKNMEDFIFNKIDLGDESESERIVAEFVRSFEERKIPIHQPPFFGNIQFEDFSELYNRYDLIKPIKVDGIEEPLIIGDMYFMHLKHQPSGKFSARSVRQTNMRGTPSKSKDYKEHRQPYSTTPVRCGEQELANMMLCDTIDSAGDEVFNMLRQYSSDPDERRSFANSLISGESNNIIPQKQSEPEVLKAMLQSVMIGFERTDIIKVPLLDDADL